MKFTESLQDGLREARAALPIIAVLAADEINKTGITVERDGSREKNHSYPIF